MKKIEVGISTPGICHHPFYIFEDGEKIYFYITSDGILLILFPIIILMNLELMQYLGGRI